MNDNEQLSLLENKENSIATILLSLREEYYEEMKTGKKKYEYRTRYQKNPTRAYIYISKTKKAISAIIEFGKPIIADSETISLISERENPGSYAAMREYLAKDIGYAIPVKKITEIESVSLKSLHEKFPNFVAPQSYIILDKKVELLDFLASKKIVKTITFEDRVDV